MNAQARIIGVHPAPGAPDVHLIEIDFGTTDEPDWLRVTQAEPLLDRSNWQVPYDERPLGGGRWAFFFHYLDLDRSLETPAGPMRPPAPTPAPDRLRDIEYEAP